jgi:lipopolysaccharide biosynthesis protein
MSCAPAITAERRLLKGGAEITEFIIKRKPTKQEIRWFYGQADNFAGVLWRLTEDGELLSWTDELTEHLEAKAAEGKASALAAVEAKIAEKKALAENAVKAMRAAPARKLKVPGKVTKQSIRKIA